MDNHLNTFFSALADPTRRAVIERLAKGPAPVSELHEPHDMALPSFMKHLSKLEDAGLIKTEKHGRVRTAHIQSAPLAQAESWLHRQRNMWEGRLDRVEALVQHLNAPDKGN